MYDTAKGFVKKRFYDSRKLQSLNTFSSQEQEPWGRTRTFFLGEEYPKL